MRHPMIALFAAGILALAAACGDSGTNPQHRGPTLARAFNAPIAGTHSSVTTYSAASDTAGGYLPQGSGDCGTRASPTGLCDGADFMGGGLVADFLGVPLNGTAPFSFNASGRAGACTYASGTGVVACDSTFQGMRIVRTLAFRTAAGAGQPRYDSTSTHSIREEVAVTGTFTRRDSIHGTWSRSSVVSLLSDRTVTGVEKGSTGRTVDGTSSGTENSTGAFEGRRYTSVRVRSDTTRAVVVPTQAGRPTFPTSGTIIRAMQVTLTYEGEAPTTSTRREVITFDGTSTARLMVVQDGTTTQCTIALPHGRPVCP
jgi:hypothetical protein